MADVKPVKAGWVNVFRPWTLHGAVVPVIIGGAVALKDDGFVWWLFIMIVVCGCLLQSAANILNTYGDFVKGTDTVENETRSPELVTGTLTPKKVLTVGLLCLGIVALCGLVFIWHTGWEMLLFGLFGIGGASLYTVGMSYKYLGLGQIGCFLCMGLLMPVGTYYTMADAWSWEPVILGLPNAFMITAVLCGNELRDYDEDRKANVGTLCGRMSYGSARKLYLIENLMGFAILAAIVAVGYAHWACLLAFAALWDAKRLYDNMLRAPEDPGCNRLLVPRAFTLNWHFGVLLTAGYLIAVYLL
ncbi:1,4-dihydroxy-2-naphthoate octaprenyltransferase [Thermoplasmatales archaeon BRNA1]|nr:1,4-dihydroxy-2-naphthoate octaprenyltransferase [Thermoplasmatales archaeon BRNA1]